MPNKKQGCNQCNVKQAGKEAALPKFSDTLTLSQPRGADHAHPLALPYPKISLITPLSGLMYLNSRVDVLNCNVFF